MFQTLVGLKKRKAVLLTVPGPVDVVDEDPEPPGPGLPAETGPSGAEVTGGLSGCAGEAGRAVGVVAGAGEAGDEAAAPGVIGPFGCPVLTGVAEADLRFVTVGLVTFVRLAEPALRLVARLCDSRWRL